MIEANSGLCDQGEVTISTFCLFPDFNTYFGTESSFDCQLCQWELIVHPYNDVIRCCLFLDETFKGVISVLATERNCFSKLKTVHMYGFPVTTHSSSVATSTLNLTLLCFHLNPHWAIISSLILWGHEFCCSQFKRWPAVVLLGHVFLARSSDCLCSEACLLTAALFPVLFSFLYHAHRVLPFLSLMQVPLLLFLFIPFFSSPCHLVSDPSVIYSFHLSC